ncbi:RidA family protein [Rhizobium leguminosarum]|uniref:RidA family protein n=1 Tax=Rhizobium leguminosarum TaxID=384 RepID=UPI001C942FDD|nr:RidA family protein [Rhizobium leguminosarum]MBY5502442.1 RidA family protein [Rhizobium leguminosarum]
MTLSQSSSLAHIHGEGVSAPVWQSEAVRAGDFIFTSGTLATDWVNGIAPEASINERLPFLDTPSERQTEYILRSLALVLQRAGSSLENVVKAHVFLHDSADFPGFDRVWKRHFPNPPTRTTVGAAGLLVPGARLEIALIALATDGKAMKNPAKSDAPRPLTKKVEAMSAGDFVFTSGQLAHNAVDGVPPEAGGKGSSADMAKQSAYTLNNMFKSLAAAGASHNTVIKTQALLLNTSDEKGFLDAWTTAFPKPAALAVTGIGSLLVGDTIIEIDLTAYKGNDLRISPLSTFRGPEAVGAGDLVFSAGVFPGFDTGTLPKECNVHPAYPHYSSAISLQTTWVLDRLEAALKSVGSDLAHVAKAQVFLTELSDFAEFDQVWRDRFASAPARSVVKASPLPVAGAKIAVEVIAATA